MKKIFLVTGAAGKQGGAVAHHLLQQGFVVRALTRDTTKLAEPYKAETPQRLI